MLGSPTAPSPVSDEPLTPPCRTNRASLPFHNFADRRSKGFILHFRKHLGRTLHEGTVLLGHITDELPHKGEVEMSGFES